MTTKIKICAGWDNSENTTRRLLDQFKTTKDDLINKKFVYDNSYDIIIFNNYISEQIKNNTKSILYFHEPSWSGNHQKTFNQEDNTIIKGYNQSLYNSKHFEECISHMFYGGMGSWKEGENFWTYNNISSLRIKKSKHVSCIASSLGSLSSHWIKGSIYRERFDAIQYLYKNLGNKIDFYGGAVNKDLRLKKDGLIDYQFSICVENSNENNYISEKFYDAILTDTIPIYFGCKNIKSVWKQNGYILLDSITDTNYLYEKLTFIINNANQLYDELIEGCLEIKDNFLTKTNLYQSILQSC